MSKKIGHRGQLHAVRAASEARNNARNKAVPFQPTSRKLRGRGMMTRHTTINQRESRSLGGMRIAGCTHGGRGGTYARVGTWRPHSSPAAPSTVNESPLSTECSPSRPATRAFGFLRGKSRAKTRTNKAPRLLVPGLGLNGCRPEGPASRGGQGRREARRRQAPRAPRHRDATRAPTLTVVGSPTRGVRMKRGVCRRLAPLSSTGASLHRRNAAACGRGGRRGRLCRPSALAEAPPARCHRP